MSTTEIVLVSPSLSKILSYRSLKMPMFQRHYGWGEPGKESLGLSYFSNFLANPEASTFFGQINLFSTSRWDYYRDEGVEVGISDGQHRLVTLVLSILAVRARLMEVVNAPVALDEHTREAQDDDKYEARRILENPAIKSMCDCTLEVVYHPSGKKAKVVPFVNESLEKFLSFEVQRNEIELAHGRKKHALKEVLDRSVRSAQLKELNIETRRALSGIDEQETALKRIGVVATYLEIYSEVKPMGVAKFLRLAERFALRLTPLKPSVVCLQPSQGFSYSEDDGKIEAEAFNMFAQLNGQAVPLSSGELLKSFIESRVEKNLPLRSAFNPDTPEYQALSYFGLTDAGDFCDFLAKADTGNGNQKNYTWIKSTLYVGSPPTQKLDDLNEWVSCLVSAHSQISSLPEPWTTLFRMFIADIARVPHVVLIARCVKNEEKVIDSTHLKNLLKALLLTEIAAQYRPPHDARFNTSRDLPGAVLSSPAAVVQFVKRHFGEASGADFKSALCKFIANAPLGEAKSRALAKILLIVHDIFLGTRDIRIGKNISFEHVFPQKHENLLDDESLPSQVSAGIIEIAELPPAEKNRLINCLGNGALLGPQINSALSNLSPYQKRISQNERPELTNAWWPSHLRDLQESQGNFNKSYILARSERLAQGIASFLTSV